MKRVFAHLLVVTVVLVCSAPAFAAERPNVVLISVDDLRAVDRYDPQVATPNLERLAGWGVQFKRAYVQATYCNPSRSSFMTGLRPETLGIHSNRSVLQERRPNVTSLPAHFRAAGYQTLALGKLFHRHAPPEAWGKQKRPGPTETGREGEGRNLSGGKLSWMRWRAAAGGDMDQPDGRTAQEAAAFLRQEHEQPFLLGIGFAKPHDPYVAPKRDFERYPLEELELHEDPAEMSPTPAAQFIGPWRRIMAGFSERDRRELLRSYYAGTTFMDRQLGRVLDALEETGLRDETIVVFLSDHGYHLGERGWWNKNTLYEYTLNSQLIVHAPGVSETGEASTEVVEFVDIFPTLLELCGLERPHEMAGQSLVPLLKDPEQQRKRRAAFAVRHAGGDDGPRGISIRTPRWRYTEWRDKQSGEVQARELFDQRADPGEFHNLAGKEAHAETMEKLRERFESRPRGELPE